MGNIGNMPTLDNLKMENRQLRMNIITLRDVIDQAQNIEKPSVSPKLSPLDKCHHPANSIIPVSHTQNLNYIITTLKSFILH